MTPTINLTVNVSTPEAAEAVLRALGAVAPAAASPAGPVSAAPMAGPAMPAAVPPAPVSVPVSVPAPAVPVAAAPAAPGAAPVQTPAAVPVAAAPAYSREQIMAAGAALIDEGKMDGLMGLLNAFGVQAVSQLKQEQLGAFATELRRLGARI